MTERLFNPKTVDSVAELIMYQVLIMFNAVIIDIYIWFVDIITNIQFVYMKLRSTDNFFQYLQVYKDLSFSYVVYQIGF